MEREFPDQRLYAVLSKNDKDILSEIFSILSDRVKANPYGDDNAYASAISQLPIGLRAMAATHHLDVSLTLDDIGWHFLNFGEPNLVKETESGLRELGLSDLADWFVEAFDIVSPLRSEIAAGGDYYECLRSHGRADRIDELTKKAREKEAGCAPDVSGSPIYDSWVRYARKHPENVFGG